MPPTLSALLASHEQVTANLRAVLRDVDGALSADAGELDERQLRARVRHLADELRDRARLEAVRLAEFLERNERLWLSRLEDFARASDAERERAAKSLADELSAALEAEHKVRLDAETRRLAEGFSADAEARVRGARQEAEAGAGALAAQRLAALDQLDARVAAHDSLLASRAASDAFSARIHRMTLASQALAHVLEQGRGPATQEVAAVQASFAGAADPVIAIVLAALPREVHARSGVPTRYALQGGFATLVKEARRAALTPEAVSGVSDTLGKAFGSGVASVVLPAAQLAASARDAVVDAVKTVSDAASDLKRSVSDAAAPVVSVFSGIASSLGLGGKARGLDGAAAPAPAAAAAPLAAPAASPGESTAESAPAMRDAFSALTSAATAASNAAAAAAAGASDIQRVGSIFDRAEAAVAHGDLGVALDVLSELKTHRQGELLASQVLSAWSDSARARLQTDRSVRLLRARTSVVAAALW